MALDHSIDISDDALLQLYANGDQAAARQLTLRLAPRAFKQAYRMLGVQADAEDVAQEAMMRVWKIAPEWRSGEAKVTTWLYRVVANLCLDRLRKVQSTSLDAIDEPIDPSPSAADDMQSNARLDALQAALIALPERQRQALVLRHIEELANPEIADVMEISVEAVESLTSRGKRALTQILKGRKAALGFEGDAP
ncbi:MAG TPA: RNA polymerase subunit sigma [Rhodobacteraceae bacterium]|uniref:RNA polymerase sigma factor n=1 Tax=Planktotalea sp. TaxID=2029877 RepID=UPI000ED54FEC|nr:RNA polymerase sigma factor [Planktotalea sp.]MDG1083658.1 RNA polymerase sigma factor [Planktotalea sp.]HCW85255.1 RNA polymerase subunit sigma [Paracoccaceae bacterium]